MRILLSDFNYKVGRKDILKPSIVNDISNKISNDNGVNNSVVKHRHINKSVKSTTHPRRTAYYYLLNGKNTIVLIKS